MADMDARDRAESEDTKAIAKLECDLDAVVYLAVDMWLTPEQIASEPKVAQRAVMAREYALRAIEKRDAKAHWYEAKIKIRDQRIQELEEQVASLQRVIQHKRDSDSVVDA